MEDGRAVEAGSKHRDARGRMAEAEAEGKAGMRIIDEAELKAMVDVGSAPVPDAKDPKGGLKAKAPEAKASNAGGGVGGSGGGSGGGSSSGGLSADASLWVDRYSYPYNSNTPCAGFIPSSRS